MKSRDYVRSRTKPKNTKPKKRGTVLTLSDYEKRNRGMKAQDFIEQYLELLPTTNGVSQVEAERRAAEFLVGAAHLSTLRQLYANELSKALSMERAMYCRILATIKGEKITENKIKIEANHEYQEYREKLEGIQSDIDYLKQHHDIFFNAHIFYRQLAKGDNNG